MADGLASRTRWTDTLARACRIRCDARLDNGPGGGRRSRTAGADRVRAIAPGVCEESGNVPASTLIWQSGDRHVPTQSTEEDTPPHASDAGELADFDALWDTVAEGDSQFSNQGHDGPTCHHVCARREGDQQLLRPVPGRLHPQDGDHRRQRQPPSLRSAFRWPSSASNRPPRRRATRLAAGAAWSASCRFGPGGPLRLALPRHLTQSARCARQRGPLAVSCQARSGRLQMRAEPSVRGQRRAVG